jgi:hypothetical protein
MRAAGLCPCTAGRDAEGAWAECACTAWVPRVALWRYACLGTRHPALFLPLACWLLKLLSSPASCCLPAPITAHDQPECPALRRAKRRCCWIGRLRLRARPRYVWWRQREGKGHSTAQPAGAVQPPAPPVLATSSPPSYPRAHALALLSSSSGHLHREGGRRRKPLAQGVAARAWRAKRPPFALLPRLPLCRPF